jgi:RNA recognition motif-containing protein
MLLLSNLPHNCSESELRRSIESRGVPLVSVRVIRDSGTGDSPAFGDVELEPGASESHALVCLAGMQIRNRIVRVREGTVLPVKHFGTVSQGAHS